MKAPARRTPDAFAQGFAAIRDELGIPRHFPPEVAAAAEVARPRPLRRHDRTDLPFVAIDPPGATDLDQAFCARRCEGGYEVSYAIADVGSFVSPGDPVDLEARSRGTTLYSPDLRTPLHPPVISEDRASLLPGTSRPALLWTLRLDADGQVTGSQLDRSHVRVREAVTYREAQRRLESGDELLGLLEEIGRLRLAIEADRGGVSLNLPAQEIVERNGSYELVYDRTAPIETWNAQISLLTGIVAGHAMVDAGVGIVRTLPPTSTQDLDQLRRQALVLGVPWPPERRYADVVRHLEPDSPARSAFLVQAARALRGAGYVSVAAALQEAPDDARRATDLRHGAIASLYAHVTAPLRRLVDRFANEILLALYAGQEPPAWAVEALEELPSLMGRARARESALDRALFDFTEAMVLAPLVGTRLRATVVAVDRGRERATVQAAEPAIVATIEAAGLALGSELDLLVVSADPATRSFVLDRA